MKKRRKNTIKAQAFIFSLLLMVVLSYGIPVKVEASNGLVGMASSQVERQAKKGYEKDYKSRIRGAKSDYRKSRRMANSDLASAMGAARGKGERIEARKKYRENLKSADIRLNTEMKNAKEIYKKQISEK